MKTLRLICIAPYHNTATGARYAVADVLEATEDEARFLFADAPDCFRYDDVTAAEVETAAAQPTMTAPNIVEFSEPKRRTRRS